MIAAGKTLITDGTCTGIFDQDLNLIRGLLLPQLPAPSTASSAAAAQQLAQPAAFPIRNISSLIPKLRNIIILPRVEQPDAYQWPPLLHHTVQHALPDEGVLIIPEVPPEQGPLRHLVGSITPADAGPRSTLRHQL